MQRQASKCSHTSSNSNSNLVAWALCALCGLIGLAGWLLITHANAPLWAQDFNLQQLGLGLCMLLLLGLWMLQSMPALAPMLLIFLVISLLGIRPAQAILTPAATDATLWMLTSLALSIAARDSGLLGYLLNRACKSLKAPHSQQWPSLRLSCVLWLTPVFALLTSPRQSAHWRNIYLHTTPAHESHERTSSAAQLAAKLIWLPAHPASLLMLALLPAGGSNSFSALHWCLSTWPLALLACCLGCRFQGNDSALVSSQTTKVIGSSSVPAPNPHYLDRFAFQSTITIALFCVVLVALQPFHGIEPGLVTALGLIALFALRVITPAALQQGMDWSLLVSFIIFPGLLESFSSITPVAFSLHVEHLQPASTLLILPLLMALRFIVPAVALTMITIIVGALWGHTPGTSLLEALLPVLVALHLVEFLTQTHEQSPKLWLRLRYAYSAPSTWAILLAFPLWLQWVRS
ncbi:hypothetical protein KUF54_08720 [Comamonas sp. Y33R10-2]|uniref:hypothetical protein n=1 Tax=Comamonas sp. Y33R10-2 TaxID=2853257 RepID=UPI001C5C85ED|nr:hypothetical protein [Comamonas sp. Y33R10-2]QXZ08215.1 hypothetical protein KUF54_08720 [Comamonas sp. Y33R10-2]